MYAAANIFFRSIHLLIVFDRRECQPPEFFFGMKNIVPNRNRDNAYNYNAHVNLNRPQKLTSKSIFYSF